MKILEIPINLPHSFRAELKVYMPEVRPGAAVQVRPAMLICPGGGYSGVSLREGEPIALKFTGMGYAAAVLTYSVAPVRYPVALTQAALAMKTLRENAEEWHLDPHKIFVIGFSAGGHLAASLGTLYDQPEVKGALQIQDEALLRPDGMVLCYPVITSGEHRNMGSHESLLGPNPDPALWEKTSLEHRVSANTPPTFLWHTADDTVVPVENSLLFAAALRKYEIPMELHIYPHGPHGLSLATQETDMVEPRCQDWPELVHLFLSSLKEDSQNA